MKIEWSDAVKLMMGNLVKIRTYGDGYGSGFVVPPPSNAAGSCCVMTAFHVIKKAHETGATISIQLADGSGAIELPSLLRTVFTVKDKDQALIIFNGPKNFGALKSLTFVSPENIIMQVLNLAGWDSRAWRFP